VLFGVKDYVPALERYIEKYNAKLNFFHNLVKIDGPAKKAWFEVAEPDTNKDRREILRHDPCRAAAGSARLHPRLARWPMPQAGSMSIRPRCGTRPTKTSGRSAM
jgi:hypothetical protein